MDLRGELRFVGEDSNRKRLDDRCCIYQNTLRHGLFTVAIVEGVRARTKQEVKHKLWMLNSLQFTVTLQQLDSRWHYFQQTAP